MPGPTVSQDDTRARGQVTGRSAHGGGAAAPLLAVCLGFFIIQLDTTTTDFSRLGRASPVRSHAFAV
jgi:hypothetical protein